MLRLWPLLFTLGGCTPPPEAPTALNDLARYLFRELPADDPAVVLAGMASLDALLDGVDLDSDEVEDRSFGLDVLLEPDVAGLERPDRSLDATLSLAVTYRSPWPLAEHLPYMVLEDLTPISSTASSYDRSFETGSPGCFLDGSCEVVHTRNDIVRDSAFLKMTYWNQKSFRRVTTDEGLVAVVARTWQPEAAHGDGDRNHIWQNYESEAWIADGDGTRRLYGVWTEAEYAGVSEDLGTALTLNAAQDALDTLDTWIEERQ